MNVESEKVEMSFKGEVSADGASMRGSADLGQASAFMDRWRVVQEDEPDTAVDVQALLVPGAPPVT